MRKVGIGVVGCGFMGTKVHLPALKKIREAKIVAVASRNEEKAKREAARFNAVTYYSDYYALVEDRRCSYVCRLSFMRILPLVRSTCPQP